MTTTPQPPLGLVSIPSASRWINEHRPEWGMTAKQLKGLCASRSVRCVVLNRATTQRTQTWWVRIPQVLADLEKAELPAL